MKRMKTALALTLCLTLAACGATEEAGTGETVTQTTTTAAETESEETERETEPPEESSLPEETTLSEESSAPERENEKKALYEVYDTITPVPAGEDKELVFMGTVDPNASDDPRMAMNVKMFKACGGRISFVNTAANERYNELALHIMTGSDVPDMMLFDNYAFPSYAVKEVFQPVDSVVDFGSPLWAETASAAELYSLNGAHYAAPIAVTPDCFVLYRRDIVELEGLDDPYELYLNGLWDWEAMEILMSKFCAGGEGRYGINGYFSSPLLRASGGGVVTYDGHSFTNGLDSPLSQELTSYLTGISSKGYLNTDWYDRGSSALESGNTLFYAMGDWALTGERTLADGDYGLVPIPGNSVSSGQYVPGTPYAFMWVAGSEKAGAFRTWLECCRTYETEEDFQKYDKEQFLSNNPAWTEEMYEVRRSACGFERPLNPEFIYGLGPEFTSIDQDLGDNIAGMLTDPIGPAFLFGDNTFDKAKANYSPLIDEYLEDYGRLTD